MSKDLEPHQELVGRNKSEWFGITVVIILMAAWPAYFLIRDNFFPPDPAGVIQHQKEKIIQDNPIKD